MEIDRGGDGKEVALSAAEQQAVMQWELTDSGPLDGRVHIQVGSLDGEGWYVRHMGFGTRRFEDKRAAWRAVRGLMGQHEGRWEQTAIDPEPFLAVCPPDGSRVLYDMNDDACLCACWGNHKDRLWDRYMAAMTAGAIARRTETHALFGGYIELVDYNDPLDGSRRHVVVTARDPGSDYRAVDYPHYGVAEAEYVRSVYANLDDEFPYKSCDILTSGLIANRSPPPVCPYCRPEPSSRPTTWTNTTAYTACRFVWTGR